MSKLSVKRMLRKVKAFVKRNALALIITATTALAVTAIALGAYFSFSGVQSADQDYQATVPTGSSSVVVFVDPLDNPKISKDYAENYLLEDKTTGIWQSHMGIDFVAKDGDKVRAVYSGTIEKIENTMMQGTVITLKINDKLKVLYKNLTSDVLVSEKDNVSPGTELGYAGTSVFEKADGVHLHLEVYENDKLVDPNIYFTYKNK